MRAESHLTLPIRQPQPSSISPYYHNDTYLLHNNKSPRNNREKEKEGEEGESGKTVKHAPSYLFGALIISIALIGLSAVLFEESENENRSRPWRAFSTSFGWSINSIGGSILTYLVFFCLLPKKLHDCVKDIQAGAL